MQLTQAALVLALLFVLPGLAWGPVLAPGSGSPIVTAGRAAAASLLVVGVACTLLAWLDILTPVVILVVLAVLTAVPFVLRSRRKALGRTLRRTRTGARRRRVVATLLAVAAVTVALVLVVLPSRQAVGEALLPFSSTVWYYANLARETALHGGFPAELPEWGTLRPFQVDYLPATAHTAAAFALLPGLDVRLVLEAYRLAVLAALVAVAALFFRRFVSSWIAVLGACLLLATVRLEGKLLAYRPETWALVPAVFTLWLVDRAMVERSPRLAATAVATAALTWMAHAEVFLLLGPGIVGLAVARLFASRGRPGAADPSTRDARDRDGRGRGRLPRRDARRRGGLVRRDRRPARGGLRHAGWIGRRSAAAPSRGRDPARLDVHRRPDLGLQRGRRRAGCRRERATRPVRRLPAAPTVDPVDLARSRRPDAG